MSNDPRYDDSPLDTSLGGQSPDAPQAGGGPRDPATPMGGDPSRGGQGDGSVLRLLGEIGLWAALVLIVVFVAAMQVLGKQAEAQAKATGEQVSPEFRLQARYIYGMHILAQQMGEGGMARGDVQGHLAGLEAEARDNLYQQLRLTPMIAELVGPSEAMTHLEGLEARLIDAAADMTDEEFDAFVSDIVAMKTIYGPPAADALEAEVNDMASAEANAQEVDAPATDTPAVTAQERATIDDELANYRSFGQLTDEQRDTLVERHSWFGKLAVSYGLANDSELREAARWPAVRTIFGAVAFVLFLLLVGLASVVVSITALVMLLTGSLKPHYVLDQLNRKAAREVAAEQVALDQQQGAVVVPPPGGGVQMNGSMLGQFVRSLPIPAAVKRLPFLEAFVLFLAAFVGVSLLRGWLDYKFGPLPMVVGLLLMLPVLLMPLYPLVRGLRWTDYRVAMGLTQQRLFPVEMGLGLLGYLACLPLVLIGIGGAVLVGFFVEGDGSHPIANEISEAGLLGILAIYFMACVMAPVMEEILFRGALYHYLRGRMGILLSVFVSGLIFAAIHPQGLIGIPVLTAIGGSLALIREWRGSLIAPMTAHAANNFMAVTLALLLLT